MKTPTLNTRPELRFQLVNTPAGPRLHVEFPPPAQQPGKQECSIEGCVRDHKAKGICAGHYQRVRNYGDPQAEKPFRGKSKSGKCKVLGCDRPYSANGYCGSHYQRHAKYGDASPEIPIGEDNRTHTVLAFLDAALKSDTDECILVKIHKGCSGYSSIKYDGVYVAQHRIVCIKTHGPPPFAGAHAAHRCGIRNCINPKHLRWRTAKQNSAEMLKHGTDLNGERCSAAKLTNEKVRAIRQSSEAAKVLATRYGVSAHSIRNVCLFKTWKHVR